MVKMPGAIANAATVENHTLLHLATRRGWSVAADVLLRHGANPNRLESASFVPPLARVYFEGECLAEGLLHTAGNGEFSLDLATSNGHMDVMRELLS